MDVTVSNEQQRDPCIIQLEDALGDVFSECKAIKQGANNRVYFVRNGKRTPQIAKFYYRHPSDPRDRMRTEYEALRFLSACGVSNIPKPLALLPEYGCALHQYLEGSPVASTEVRSDEIKQALSFVEHLSRLTTRPAARELGPASEACFSIIELLDMIERRRNRLSVPCAEYTPTRVRLHEILSNRFDPLYAKIRSWVIQQCESDGELPSAALRTTFRTLSPSDFGFHNARRGGDGTIYFLDFEYFGWDDPAKLTCDFVLHPGMQLRNEAKSEFFQGCTEIFSQDPHFISRLRKLYPLYALKWALIVLNEFVPRDEARRTFAQGNDPEQRETRQQEQITKCERLLTHVQEAYGELPYLNAQ